MPNSHRMYLTNNRGYVYNEYAPDGNYSKFLKVQDADDSRPKTDEVVFGLKTDALNRWYLRNTENIS